MFKIIADALPRFMTCNGSRLLAASVPPAPNDTAARDEGIAAHYMVSAALRGTSIIELIDRKAPNGVFMTAEMQEHAAEYMGCMKEDAGFFGVEVDTSHDYSPHWVIDGRADYIGMRTQTELHIVDYKYGYRIVEPIKNWTLISHAIGHLARNQLTVETIRFSIFQPRPYHPDGHMRSWVITYPELTQLYAQLNQALCNPTDLLVTSPHCHNCPANAGCRAAQLAEYNIIDVATMVVDDKIDNVRLAFTLDNLNRAKKMLEDRLEALSELAKHRIQSGAVVDNYSTEMGQGNTRWNEGITPDILKAMTNQDLTVPAKLVTPAEAKRRGLTDTTIKALTHRPPTGIKLVRISANKKATKLFGEGKES